MKSGHYACGGLENKTQAVGDFHRRGEKADE
jgi:hypothetical protein